MVRVYLSPVDKINKPSLRYLQVQDFFVLGSGIPWTIAYILYARQANIDKSYGMPLIPLCANIAWEFIYGVIHPNSLGQVISFVPWLIADVPIVYWTLKHGPSKWEQAPLVADNLGLILAVGIAMMLAMHLAFRRSCKNIEDGPFWSAWVCQLLISCGSVMHLMCRNETSGHSWGIW
ncbi:related to 3-ketoacyl-acyl carrier protein reductase [Rhynchosporium secalis]|uniref:Related to 3-ketoacyl-acyl carrier protein reductase n=1 Tax=Rhynchosporium secalis TaxID=38038 RepID=A0A1E1MJF4_RHYSE|nr:related to 3-ketoacyl-acyl carrier protein reductase [Rhynchosporium secalis]